MSADADRYKWHEHGPYAKPCACKKRPEWQQALIYWSPFAPALVWGIAELVAALS